MKRQQAVQKLAFRKYQAGDGHRFTHAQCNSLQSEAEGSVAVLVVRRCIGWYEVARWI